MRTPKVIKTEVVQVNKPDCDDEGYCVTFIGNLRVWVCYPVNSTAAFYIHGPISGEWIEITDVELWAPHVKEACRVTEVQEQAIWDKETS